MSAHRRYLLENKRLRSLQEKTCLVSAHRRYLLANKAEIASRNNMFGECAEAQLLANKILLDIEHSQSA